MDKHEIYLRKALEEAQADRSEADRKIVFFQKAISEYQETKIAGGEDLRELDDDAASRDLAAKQGLSGLEIMLRHMPETGLAPEELVAMLEKYGVGEGKKRGMIQVSIDVNLSPRGGNLEIRDGRYFLTEKAKAKRKQTI